MERNLSGRVEALVPIRDPRMRDRIEELLRVYLADDRLAWELHRDHWEKVSTITGLSSHVRFQALAHGRSQGALPDPDAAATPSDPTVVAAGGIVSRPTKNGTEVLVVHRPRYSDWTFPKGKVDDGESLAEAALRSGRGDGVSLRARIRNRRRRVPRPLWRPQVRSLLRHERRGRIVHPQQGGGQDQVAGDQHSRGSPDLCPRPSPASIVAGNSLTYFALHRACIQETTTSAR